MRTFSALEKFISISELLGSNFTMNNPVKNGRVVILDIDHCLYASKELKIQESGKKRQEFIDRFVQKKVLQGGEKDSKIEEAECIVNENTRKGKTNMELFYYQLGMNSQEYYSKYDNMFDYSKFIEKNEQLIYLVNLLTTKHCRLFAMTNSSDKRAEKILSILELTEYFEKVFCAIIIGQELSDKSDRPRDLSDLVIIKPDPRAYEAVDNFIGAKDPKDITFFDDSKRNVEASKKFNWKGVFVEQYKDESAAGNKLIQELEKYLEQLN